MKKFFLIVFFILLSFNCASNEYNFFKLDPCIAPSSDLYFSKISDTALISWVKGGLKHADTYYIHPEDIKHVIINERTPRFLSKRLIFIFKANSKASNFNKHVFIEDKNGEKRKATEDELKRITQILSEKLNKLKNNSSSKILFVNSSPVTLHSDNYLKECEDIIMTENELYNKMQQSMEKEILSLKNIIDNIR
jgi:hypothetical protein